MKKCNCWIGILNSYDQSDTNYLYMDDYVEKIKQRVDTSLMLSKTLFHDKVFVMKDYIDGRKSMSIRFKYCPLCARKINWKEIREVLKEN